MKTLHMIYKGILLWAAALLTLILLLSIDNIHFENLLLYTLLLLQDIVIIRLVISNITIDEFKTLSGYNLYNQFFHTLD